MKERDRFDKLPKWRRWINNISILLSVAGWVAFFRVVGNGPSEPGARILMIAIICTVVWFVNYPWDFSGHHLDRW